MDDPDSHSRVRVACENCRKRKRKCDGLQPTCTWCLTRNIECLYILNKPSKRKHDPDYAKGLEDQVELLREEVARLRALIPDFNATGNDSNKLNRDNEQFRSEDDKAHVAPIPRDMSPAISDVSAMMWRMNIDETGESTFIGPSGNFCFPTTHPEAYEVIGESRRSSQLYKDNGFGSHEALYNSVDEAHITNYLIYLFSNFINPVHFFLDNETLVIIQQQSVGPPLALIKYAVLAAASLLSDDTSSKEYGNMMASAFDAAALTVCRDNANVSIVRAFSIMCWRQLGLEQHKMAWMYNSMCASMMLHLGLHVSSLHALEESKIITHNDSTNLDPSNVRLKTLWSAVLMDRIATSLTGRNCMVPWRRVRANSFLDAVGPSPTLDEVVFDHHCRLWFIHDQCMDPIYSFEFDTLKKSEQHRLLLDARERLFTFHRSMDSRVQFRRDLTSPTLIILHMSYNMSQMLIHRPYLKEAPDSSLYRLSVRSMSTAANNMVKLIREFERIAQFDKAPYFVSHSVLTAAITHLLLATSEESTIRTRSISRFRVCFNCLFAMRARWIKADRSVSLLRELAHRWGVMSALPLQNGFPDPRNVRPITSQNPMPPNTGTSDPLHSLDNAFDASTWADVDPVDFSSYVANIAELDPTEAGAWDLARIFDET